MKNHRFTIDQIVRIVGESYTPGSSVLIAARKYGVSDVTIYKWRKKYGGLEISEAARFKAVEAENWRLKRLLAEKELELQVLQDILKKKS